MNGNAFRFHFSSGTAVNPDAEVELPKRIGRKRLPGLNRPRTRLTFDLILALFEPGRSISGSVQSQCSEAELNLILTAKEYERTL